MRLKRFTAWLSCPVRIGEQHLCVDFSNDFKDHSRNMRKFRKIIFKNRHKKHQVAWCVFKAAGRWRVFTRSEYFCFLNFFCHPLFILERIFKRRLELYQLAIKKIETVSVFVDIRTDLQKDQMHRYLFIMAVSKVRLMLRVSRVVDFLNIILIIFHSRLFGKVKKRHTASNSKSQLKVKCSNNFSKIGMTLFTKILKKIKRDFHPVHH